MSENQNRQISHLHSASSQIIAGSKSRGANENNFRISGHLSQHDSPPPQMCSSASSIQHPNQQNQTLRASRSDNAQSNFDQNCDSNNDAIVEYSPHGTWLTWLKSVSDTPRSRRNHTNSAITSSQANQTIRAYDRQTLRLPANTPPNRTNKMTMKSLDDVVSNETERTTAESLTHYDQRHRKSQSTRKPAAITEQIERQKSIIIGLDSDSNKPKPKPANPNMILKYLVAPIRKHPLVVALVSCLISVICIVLLCCIVWWLIPILIQTSLNYTNVHIEAATITDPEVNSFYLSAKSVVERPNFHAATVRSFDADVYYMPTSTFPSKSSNSQTRAMRHLRDSNSTTDDKKLFDSKIDAEKLKLLEPFKLGKVKIPALQLLEGYNNIDFSGKFNVTNSTQFTSFFKDFLQSSSVNWYISASVSVDALGMTYRDLQIFKPITFRGLHISHLPSIEYSESDRGAKGMVPFLKSVVKIMQIDLTSEYPMTRISATVNVLMKDETISLKPFGVLEFVVSLDNTNILTFVSDSSVSLQPGDNIIKFQAAKEGSIFKLIPVPIFEKIYQSIYNSNLVLMKAKGVSSSVPLYNNVMPYVHFELPVHVPTDPNQKTLQSSVITEVKLFESETDKENLNILLQTDSRFHNILGDSLPFKLNVSPLTGTIRIDSASPHTVHAFGHTSSKKRSEPLSEHQTTSFFVSTLQKLSTETIFSLKPDNQEESIRYFIAALMREPEVSIDTQLLINDLRAVFPNEEVSFKAIPFNYTYKVKGFSNFTGFKLLKMTRTESSNSSDLLISLEYKNDSPISFDAGAMTLTISDRFSTILELKAASFKFEPGYNVLEFKFDASANSMERVRQNIREATALNCTLTRDPKNKGVLPRYLDSFQFPFEINALKQAFKT